MTDLKTLLRDIGAFSATVIGRPLRPYQLAPARAILAAIAARSGQTFTIMMSRQAGKNELSAHLECYLLTLSQHRGGQIVKAAPTFRPQLLTSLRRLERCLDNPWTQGRWRREAGHCLRLGRARCLFLSAAPTAHVVGATAHHLLEFDEAQDIAPDKHDRDFAPMAAATNCVRVYYGTAATGHTLLETLADHHRALERRDGQPRHFHIPWWVVAEHNPAYARYVETERARLGERHPFFRTQYCLEPVSATGGLFSPDHLARLVGTHPPLAGPLGGERYVAGVDLAGGPLTDAPAPNRDATVVTIAAVEDLPLLESLRIPTLRLVAHVCWTGLPYHQQAAALVGLLRDHWHCQRVVVDATGPGATVAELLRLAMGSAVEPFICTAQSKSALGYALLAAVGSGRLRMYCESPGQTAGPPAAQPRPALGAWSQTAVTFWEQLERAEYHLGPHHLLQFGVPPNRGHDDFLLSLALCLRAAGDLGPAPTLAVVPPHPWPD